MYLPWSQRCNELRKHLGDRICCKGFQLQSIISSVLPAALNSCCRRWCWGGGGWLFLSRLLLCSHLEAWGNFSITTAGLGLVALSRIVFKIQLWCLTLWPLVADVGRLHAVWGNTWHQWLQICTAINYSGQLQDGVYMDQTGYLENFFYFHTCFWHLVNQASFLASVSVCKWKLLLVCVNGRARDHGYNMPSYHKARENSQFPWAFSPHFLPQYFVNWLKEYQGGRYDWGISVWDGGKQRETSRIQRKGTRAASMRMTVFRTGPGRSKDDIVAGLRALYLGIQPVRNDAKNGCIS